MPLGYFTKLMLILVDLYRLKIQTSVKLIPISNEIQRLKKCGGFLVATQKHT